jgi:hypothetical protein
MSDLQARTAAEAQGGPEALAMHTLGGTVLNASDCVARDNASVYFKTNKYYIGITEKLPHDNLAAGHACGACQSWAKCSVATWISVSYNLSLAMQYTRVHTATAWRGVPGAATAAHQTSGCTTFG